MYKILINESGVPVLIEVPEKPKEARPYSPHVMFRDELRKWRKYDEALSAALADKSKHIAFKDEKSVFKLLPLIDPAKWKYKASKDKSTFDLPDNLGVSFESCKMCEGTGQYEKPYQQFIKCNYCSNGKLAILTPITEAPVKSEGEHPLQKLIDRMKSLTPEEIDIIQRNWDKLLDAGTSQ